MDFIELKAKHFKNTNFLGHGWMYGSPCPIEKWAMEMFKTDQVSEGVSRLNVFGEMEQEIRHERYDHFMYLDDMKMAMDCGFDDTTIRTIKIIVPTYKIK